MFPCLCVICTEPGIFYEVSFNASPFIAFSHPCDKMLELCHGYAQIKLKLTIPSEFPGYYWLFEQ